LAGTAIDLSHLGKYEEAIKYFNKVLAIDPYRINVLINKAIALGNLTRYDEAITYFNKVLASKPSDIGFRMEVSKNKQMALDALKTGNRYRLSKLRNVTNND